RSLHRSPLLWQRRVNDHLPTDTATTMSSFSICRTIPAAARGSENGLASVATRPTRACVGGWSAGFAAGAAVEQTIDLHAIPRPLLKLVKLRASATSGPSVSSSD